MTFTDDLWAATVPIRDAISRHPFLVGLRDGSLDREVFAGYLAQDARYLGQYARVLAGLAAQASDPDDVTFWSRGATEAIVVERQLHATHVADLDGVEPSPTCLAYTSYLLSLLSSGSYAVCAAGVLPCYWVYADVGAELSAGASDLDAHPYADWITVYADPGFAAEAGHARAIVDRIGNLADSATATAMTRAFVTATRYEWMFWDAAWRRETWPV